MTSPQATRAIHEDVTVNLERSGSRPVVCRRALVSGLYGRGHVRLAQFSFSAEPVVVLRAVRARRKELERAHRDGVVRHDPVCKELGNPVALAGIPSGRLRSRARL